MKYFTDGFNYDSNPSPKGGGFTIVDESGALVHREVINKSGFTNNEGEIRGILWALEKAENGDIISTDSLCCLTWANKGSAKPRPDLLPVLQRCKELLRSKTINLMWERREFNLAGILNEQTKGSY